MSSLYPIINDPLPPQNQDYDALQEKYTKSDPPKSGHPATKKTSFPRREQLTAIATPTAIFTLPANTVYRCFSYRDSRMSSWLPVQLFLWLLTPVLDLLLFHTNTKAMMDTKALRPWKPLSILEIRRYL